METPPVVAVAIAQTLTTVAKRVTAKARMEPYSLRAQLAVLLGSVRLVAVACATAGRATASAAMTAAMCAAGPTSSIGAGSLCAVGGVDSCSSDCISDDGDVYGNCQACCLADGGLQLG